MKMFAVGTLLLLAGIAFAQDESQEPDFLQLDTNADGRVSKDEAQADARVAEQFDAGDANRDGYLSVQEFVAIWS